MQDASPRSKPRSPEIPYFDVTLKVRTIADIEAFEAIPLAERGLPDNTYEMLRLAAETFPDRPALHFFENGDHLDEVVTFSHREFFANVTRAANVFHGLGVQPDDVIALLSPASPEMQFALWGGQAAGVICPINWMLEPGIIARLIVESGATVLVAYGPDPEIDVWEKVGQIVAATSQIRTVVKLGGGPVSTPGVVDFAKAMNAAESGLLLGSRIIRPVDRAALFHTGGTTGAPKLAVQSHANQVFMTWISALQYGVGSEDVRVCAVPLFHVNGVMTNSLMPIARGASTVLATRAGWRDPSVLRNIWRIVEQFGVTILPMVPSVANSILTIPLAGSDIGTLKLATSGTAPLSRVVAREFEAKTGARIIEGYGLTETTAVSAANPRFGEARIGSIGLRKAYQQMKVVKVDGRGEYLRDCATGEPGIIAIKGPNVISGYLRAEANEGLFLADGWLNTGDIGYQDSESYFWVTGREKDLIIRGGHNIDPKMIEEAFFAHPDVAEAAAVGMPDAHAGELPVIYVALKPDARVRPGRLKFYAYETLAERAAVPKEIFVLPVLPKTGVGKIQKNLLREDALTRVAEQMLSDVAPPGQVSVAVRAVAGAPLTCIISLAEDVDDREALVAKIRDCLKSMTIPFEIVA